MPQITATATGQPQITATVGETKIDVAVAGETKVDVAVGGGVGPSGVITVSAPLVNSGAPSAAALAISIGDGLAVVDGALAADYAGPSFTAAVVSAAPPTTDASLLTHGTLSAFRLPASGVAAGQYTSVTVDSYGRVTAGGNHSVSWGDLTGKPTTVAGAGLTDAVVTSDSRLSDAREWSASTVSQADAEAGISTSRFAFTPLRVFQAVAAWWSGSSAKAKLDGIATGATANATDAQLRDRSTHTGTQTASTISDFAVVASAAAPVQSVAGKTGVVTLAKADVGLSNVDNTADSAKPVSVAQAAADSAVASAAASDATSKANAAQAYAIQRANHTGSQAISTVAGLQDALDGKQPAGSYAPLVNNLVPSANLPSYVDDVLEYANLAALPVTGEAGKIYVALDTGRIYRWGGSAYVEISPSPGSTDAVPEGSTNLYFTNARASSAAPVQSVAGRTGAVTIAAADVSGLSSIATSGSASDLGSGTVPLARLPVGTGSTQVAAGNHTHTVTALGVGTGAPSQVLSVNGAATGLLWITLGTAASRGVPSTGDASSTQVVLGSDTRLSDARTPTSHTHTASAITDFTAAVVAAAPPTVDASLLTQGTLPDARLSSNIARTSDVSSAVASLVNSSPAALDTLGELAAALGNDANFATTVTNSLAGKAPINSPTFTGTVSGITATMVGLGNVPNVDATSRANHTGTQTASTISDFASAAVSAVTWTTLTGKPTFATVATSGAYSDLTGTPAAYSLPTASGSVLGGVKIGSGISIDGTGVISASAGYTLPAATTTTLGGVIVGTGLAVSSGTVSVVTYDVRSDTVSSTSYIGRAVSGSATSASVWTIRRTVLTSAGAVSSTTTATGVAWDDRLTATYS